MAKKSTPRPAKKATPVKRPTKKAAPKKSTY